MKINYYFKLLKMHYHKKTKAEYLTQANLKLYPIKNRKY
jgi:hypothetical protein